MRTKTGNLLRAIVEDLMQKAELSFDMLDAFLMSAGSVRILARNMHMVERNYYSSMQSLERSGYVKKTENNQFLITPKGIKKIRRMRIEDPGKIKRGKWDGNWRIIVFDLPNDLSHKRNIFRSAIKRNGFLGLQKSVYISPFVDFEEIAFLRDELGIAQYVTFLIAQVPPTDSDVALKKKFRL
jgi:phenylacetic acid degradation operon negative regulatory protein